ncbi:MAG: carbohydrate porin [Azospirillaceae bacterium]|nr:carbohydrate porin [Azospirillaceae bacterium]
MDKDAKRRGRACRRRRVAYAFSTAVGAWMTTLAGAALAAPPPMVIPVDPDAYQNGQTDGGPFAFVQTLGRSNYMLGDMWGLRTFLSRYGMSLGIQETSEVLGNVTGGSRKGFEYDGLTTATLQMDTNRAFGLYGGTFNASALYLHGRNLSTDNLQTLQTASGIESDRSVRLWELWYQQKFLEEDRLDVKIGQQSLDQEFMVSQNALLFVNTMFGWPMVPSADMPGGGPAYPLSALGVRVRARPTDNLTFLAGVFNGSPAPSNNGDPQQLNPSGTSFPIHGGKLAIAEVQYTYPALGSVVYPDETPPLARTYKLGVWYDAENFDDLRYDDIGLSLADPASSGNARQHHGDFALYAVADQMVWVDSHDNNRNLSVFGRIMGTPQSDRNLIDFSLNAGIVLHQPLPYRNTDTLGIGVGHTHVSQQAAALDRDQYLYDGTYTPVRHTETFVEVTYQYQVRPWWQLQPDIQYVFNPGGGVADPNSPNQRIGNEVVLGLRTNILF